MCVCVSVLCVCVYVCVVKASVVTGDAGLGMDLWFVGSSCVFYIRLVVKCHSVIYLFVCFVLHSPSDDFSKVYL